MGRWSPTQEVRQLISTTRALKHKERRTEVTSSLMSVFPAGAAVASAPVLANNAPEFGVDMDMQLRLSGWLLAH